MNDITLLIIPKLKVPRNLTPSELLHATGRELFANPIATSMLPRGGKEEVDFHLFQPNPAEYVDGHIRPEDVEQIYLNRWLEPDPYALVFAQLLFDSVFQNRIESFSSWAGRNGNRYYLELYTWADGKLYVGTGLDDQKRPASWWLGGVPKEPRAMI
jgi:hypothetical protein